MNIHQALGDNGESEMTNVALRSSNTGGMKRHIILEIILVWKVDDATYFTFILKKSQLMNFITFIDVSECKFIMKITFKF